MEDLGMHYDDADYMLASWDPDYKPYPEIKADVDTTQLPF